MSFPQPVLHPDPYRVALLAFSDGRRRVHNSLKDAIERHGAVLREAISRDPLLAAVDGGEAAWSGLLARGLARGARRNEAEAAVFNIPVFAFPNFSTLAARVLDLPVLLSSPRDGSLPGLGGIMAAHGAMDQIGVEEPQDLGNPLEDAALAKTLQAWCRASGTIERMKGSVYGLFGGRSIGMNTGAVSPQQWMSRFGVDVEHVDQLEIVRRAREADPEEVERAYGWLSEHAGRVSVEGKAAPENVKQQIRQYMALRSIISDYGMDFVGVRRHFDLSEYFHTACLSAMSLNDPYDWNGPKDATVMACEADSDGALTMQVLKLLSGFPSLLFDVRSYDFANEVFVCCNCGAMPSWYARRSDDPAENLACVFIDPVIPKYGGGGAHYNYVCREGEITLARLTRSRGEYRMFAARGEFVNFPREKMAETCAAWPHGYVRMDVEPQDFIERFGANHAHVVPGDHMESLRYYCELMEIPLDAVE